MLCLILFCLLGFSNQFCIQTYNALFIVRCFTKYLVETYNEEEIVQQFEARPISQTSKYNLDSALNLICLFKLCNYLIVIVINSRCS